MVIHIVSPMAVCMSCIDLALVSNLSQLRKCEVIPPLTDYDHGHSGLWVSMSWKDVKRPAVNGYGKRTIWKYAQDDFTKACSLIEATNWESLLTGDINQALANWEAKYMEIMGLCIPKKPLPKQRNLPWLTKELTKGIRKRNLLYWCARRGGNSLLFDQYKEQRNKVVKELHRSKSHSFRSFNPSNPKQF